MTFAQFHAGGEAVDAGKNDVEQHQIGLEFFVDLKRAFARFGVRQ